MFPSTLVQKRRPIALKTSAGRPSKINRRCYIMYCVGKGSAANGDRKRVRAPAKASAGAAAAGEAAVWTQRSARILYLLTLYTLSRTSGHHV